MLQGGPCTHCGCVESSLWYGKRNMPKYCKKRACSKAGGYLTEGGQRFRRGGGGSSAKRTQASGSAGRSRVSCEHALQQHEGQRHLQVLWVSVRPAPLRLCPAALLRAQLTSHVLLCRLDARLVNPESLSYCQLRNELMEDDYEPEYLLHARWHEDGDDSRGYVTTAWATTGMLDEIDASVMLAAKVEDLR